MATIQTLSTVQAGVTAPALVDPQTHGPKVNENKTREAGEASSQAAVVELSEQAHNVPPVPEIEAKEDPLEEHQGAPQDQHLGAKDKASPMVNMSGRKTSFDLENGQIEVRQGDEVIREIPADEVLKIREHIEKFRQDQEKIDISA